MATKKSSRKKKNSTSRRNIILLITATVLSALIIWTSISAARQQQLEREDREKFTVLESDMGKLKSQLDATANAGEWKLDKYCEKPGIKFYTGDAGYCRILIEPLDVAARPNYQDVKKAVSKVGRIDSEGYGEVAEKDYIGFTFLDSGKKCGGHYVRNSDETLENINFWCGYSALHMYYAER